MNPLFVLSLLVVSTIVHAQEDDCMKETLCSRTAPVVVFNGDRELVSPVKVTVCRPYWDKLSVGTLPNGRKTKWWGPTLLYKEKYRADLPSVSQECVTMWRYPGEQVESVTNCLDGTKTVIVTEKFTKPGKYYLRPSSSKKGDK